jgi:hypothetical protein
MRQRHVWPVGTILEAEYTSPHYADVLHQVEVLKVLDGGKRYECRELAFDDEVDVWPASKLHPVRDAGEPDQTYRIGDEVHVRIRNRKVNGHLVDGRAKGVWVKGIVSEVSRGNISVAHTDWNGGVKITKVKPQNVRDAFYGDVEFESPNIEAIPPKAFPPRKTGRFRHNDDKSEESDKGSPLKRLSSPLGSPLQQPKKQTHVRGQAPRKDSLNRVSPFTLPIYRRSESPHRRMSFSPVEFVDLIDSLHTPKKSQQRKRSTPIQRERPVRPRAAMAPMTMRDYNLRSRSPSPIHVRSRSPSPIYVPSRSLSPVEFVELLESLHSQPQHSRKRSRSRERTRSRKRSRSRERTRSPSPQKGQKRPLLSYGRAEMAPATRVKTRKGGSRRSRRHYER